MRALIAFDIADDSRRRRVTAVLLPHGERLQESVFDIALSDAELGRLKSDLEAELDLHHDVLHVFQLCRDCHRLAHRIPDKPADADDGHVIIVYATTVRTQFTAKTCG